MNKVLFTYFVFVFSAKTYAQNITINPNGITPKASEYYPRLSNAEILSLPNPQAGDLAYDKTCNCLRVYSLSKWLCTYQDPQNYIPNIVLIASAGGRRYDSGMDIAVDDSSNVYITGKFEQTATFGSTSITSKGDGDIYVAKYNKSGVLRWVRSAGGTLSDLGYNVTVDGSGNVYVVAYYYGSATFGSITKTTSSGFEHVLVKYNKNGDLQWVKSMPGNTSIIFDSSDNLYTTGEFYGELILGSTTLISQGKADIYIAKYDNGGNVQWASSAGGTGNDYGKNIGLDKNGNLYILGSYQGTANFGSITKSTTENSEDFIARYDSANANWVWVQPSHGSDLAVDNSGNVYLSGSFFDTITFGLVSITSRGMTDIFVAKYNSGGTFQWVKSEGGPDYDSGWAINVDSNNNVYLTGYYNTDANFGSTIKVSQGAGDIYVAKYNNDGILQWVKTAGGPWSDTGQSIVLDRNGSIFVTGSYVNDATFGSQYQISQGNSEIFIIRLD
jgi:hypothetical protein